MSVTLKRVVDNLEAFANNHGQLKSFGFGDFYQVDTVKDRLLPCLWVTPVPSTLTNTQLNDKYQIAVFDALDENDTNEILLDVLSDTREILIDIVRYYWEDIDNNGFVLDETSSTLIPFERFDIQTAGYFAELTFILEKSLNRCEVPED